MKKDILSLVFGVLVLTAASVASARVNIDLGIGIPIGGYAPPPAVVYQPAPYYAPPPPVVYYGGGYWGGDRGRHWGHGPRRGHR
jgi:hypothetical protein